MRWLKIIRHMQYPSRKGLRFLLNRPPNLWTITLDWFHCAKTKFKWRDSVSVMFSVTLITEDTVKLGSWSNGIHAVQYNIVVPMKTIQRPHWYNEIQRPKGPHSFGARRAPSLQASWQRTKYSTTSSYPEQFKTLYQDSLGTFKLKILNVHTVLVRAHYRNVKQSPTNT